jgi:hypothetical protein
MEQIKPLSKHFGQKIVHSLRLAWLMIWLIWRIARAAPKKIKTLRVLLKDESTDAPFWKRIRQYAIVMSLIEALFSRLTGSELDAKQAKSIAILSGLVPLFDDLLDEHQYSLEEIKALCALQPQRPDVLAERVCLRLFEAGGFTWSPQWEEVVVGQLGNIPDATPSSQSVYKGGHSVLLGLELIGTHDKTVHLRVVAWRFGAFAQLLDDIFDIWHDTDAGIKTSANANEDVDAVIKQYKVFVTHLIISIRALPYSTARIRDVSILLTPLVALGFWALKCLIPLQSTTDGIFQPEKYTRKQLVCDMALWRNRFGWTWTVLRLL